MKVYGITSCSTVKKARAWLDAHGVAYEFVDFKKQPPARSQLARWIDDLGWETVLNRRGTTWRMLGPDVQRSVRDADSATAVMLANPSAIKRPIVESGGEVLAGFDEAAYAARFAQSRGTRRAARA